MKVLVQRVKEAKVRVEEEVVGSIGKGLLVFLAVKDTDTGEEIDWLVNKITNLRIFEDAEGKLNRSMLDEHYEILVVSQFTLYGDCQKGNRPSFIHSAKPDIAEKLYNEFVEKLKKIVVKVETGKFQHMMDVTLTNWGPTTLVIEK